MSSYSQPVEREVGSAESTPRSLDALEREITELASHIHAATCRWLCLIAEFDAREGWAQWGSRSCADWVSWRCAIAPVAAREHVRVARRLQDLPGVREAFSAGRLSYSKVRALTRLEDVEREDELLELARHATAAQLERLVRAYRGVVAVERAAAGGRPERWLRWTYDDDGSLVLRGHLPAEEGALVVAALETARDTVLADRARSASAEAPVPTTGEHASAEAPGSNAAEGASAETPEPTTEEARADGMLLLAESFLAGERGSRAAGDRYQVVVHVDAGTLSDDTPGERCELDACVPLAAQTARRVACDAAIVPLLERGGKPLAVGRKTRSIPPALRRALAARDGGCRFPGCGARRFVDAHHIRHWANGGTTDLTNLVQLCRHHHRLLHEGGYTVERCPGGRFAFNRPDGRRIADCPQAPRGRIAGLTASPRRGHPRPPVVRPDACVSLGAGQRLDLDLGVQALLAFAPIREATNAQRRAEPPPHRGPARPEWSLPAAHG